MHVYARARARGLYADSEKGVVVCGESERERKKMQAASSLSRALLSAHYSSATKVPMRVHRCEPKVGVFTATE